MHITLPLTFPGRGVWWFSLVSVSPWSAQSITYYFSIYFDSNASWSLPPPLGLYIYNLISSLLLVDIAMNLHKSSKSRCQAALRTLWTWPPLPAAAAFTAFLVLAFFVLCLTVIMSLAEEYESLFSCTEEDKGNCPLSKPVLNPHCGCLGDNPICHGTHFCGGYLFYMQLATSFVGCRNIMGSQTRDRSRYIMDSKLNGMMFLPYCTTYEK